MVKKMWLVWFVLSLVLLTYYGRIIFFSEQKTELLIGDSTYGHFQIEMECSACHTEGFGGQEVLQDACINCHSEELQLAQDSHPKKKFTDPRNVDRLAIVDARYCTSCHTEHKKEQAHEMGLTLPKDYCFHCHEEVFEERESHEGLSFDSCASSGCHNYHDNRALYESFLVKNSGGAWLKSIEDVSVVDVRGLVDLDNHPTNNLRAIERASEYPIVHEEWLLSSHGTAGVTCAGCHVKNKVENEVNNKSGQTNVESEHDVFNQVSSWIEKPGIEQCQSCHVGETETYMNGRHGMRLVYGLSGVTPQDSDHAFIPTSLNTEHSCLACHAPHNFDVKKSGVETCLSCHNDGHSAAYLDSPHGKSYLSDPKSLNSVTCATCHMPIINYDLNGKNVNIVNHNQNENLRPNEKMIRPVCMGCHNLEFSIDALADKDLIKKNFSGKPTTHIPSIDWAIENSK